MPADTLAVREARAAEIRVAFALRERVFCGEQGVSREAERDGRDSEAIHVVAVDGRVVGTCRVLLEGQTARLGRMAVAAERRRQGVGTAILREAESLARRRGARLITLHAQLGVRGLYARNGYVETGDPFI